MLLLESRIILKSFCKNLQHRFLTVYVSWLPSKGSVFATDSPLTRLWQLEKTWRVRKSSYMMCALTLIPHIHTHSLVSHPRPLAPCHPGARVKVPHEQNPKRTQMKVAIPTAKRFFKSVNRIYWIYLDMYLSRNCTNGTIPSKVTTK